MFNPYLEEKMKIKYRNPEAGAEIERLLQQKAAIDKRLREINEANPITLEEFLKLAKEARAEKELADTISAKRQSRKSQARLQVAT